MLEFPSDCPGLIFGPTGTSKLLDYSPSTMTRSCVAVRHSHAVEKAGRDDPLSPFAHWTWTSFNLEKFFSEISVDLSYKFHVKFRIYIIKKGFELPSTIVSIISTADTVTDRKGGRESLSRRVFRYHVSRQRRQYYPTELATRMAPLRLHGARSHIWPIRCSRWQPSRF